MNPSDFVQLYQNALSEQNWNAVEPLISENAAVTFSNGQVNLGKENIKNAFLHNFSIIKNETFLIENISWVVQEDTYAVYLFEYKWSGIVDNDFISGGGVGTSIIIKEGSKWKLLSEHLGKNKA